MAFHRFLLMALPMLVSAAVSIDCSRENSCFGEPYGCSPNAGCNSLFHFDTDHNLHFYIRNFTDMSGYAAFAVNRSSDETIEYFVILPYQRQLLRAHADFGGRVLISEKRISGDVEYLGKTDFRCTFPASELPTKFQQEQLFFVSKGTFVESFFVHDGIQLFNLEDDAQFDIVSAEVPLTPSIYHIGSQVGGSSMEDVLTSDEKDSLSEAISNLPKSPKSKTDRDLETLAQSGSKTRDSHSRRRQYPEYEYEDEDREEMESRPRRRHSNNARGRSTRKHREEGESDDENEDYEEEESKTRKTNRRSRNDDDDILDDEDNFKPRRKPYGGRSAHRNREEDDYEDDEDYEEDNSFKPRKTNRRSRIDDEDESKPRKTQRGRKNKKDSDEDELFDTEENDEDWSDLDNSGSRLDKRKHIVCDLVAIALILVFMF
ncbi:uncharacterized protein CELE_R04D3.3 [Caenorhabditis elegans]|uniref:Uncharacterized protein n=1 Tax=Caenorhabditis elegans TaxID=6239 RepID=Q21713_CAEEL|nr:Uncharacterized protein CELE_R04D3.3 [Caenorhabditis elegans]CAA94163.1 Uncharacterized protein CELE_R04D3.3 [Caenorhabditis elegans]|eukprot:NP_510210.1 Uncharacterized protein CELE_R04D3.3 [Caenorhabditis elegans]